MRIDPGTLLTFLAVAEAGGFNRAAAVLHKSQPALTRTIHQLEDLIGAAVFARHVNGVELTPSGEWLLGYARAIRHQLNEAQEGLENIKRNQRPRITIGTAAVHPVHLFAKALMDVLSGIPEIDVRITLGAEGTLLEQLKNGALSFIIVPMPKPFEISSMHCETIFLEQSAIYCRPDHPVAMLKSPTVKDLHDASWLLGPPGTLHRDRLEALFVSEGLSKAKIALEIEDLRLRRAVTPECPYLSVFARHHLEEAVSAGQLVEVNFPYPQERRPVVAIQLSEHSNGQVMNTFVKALRERYAQGGFDVMSS